MLKTWWRAISILFDEKWLTLFIVLSSSLVGAVNVYEQVLFGRVVDSLTQQSEVLPIIFRWAAIGLVGIISSVFISIMSDRLAHRKRMQSMAAAFERAISMPSQVHVEKGSGAIVRTILQGSGSLFWSWLPFLRQHLTAIVSLSLLIPTALKMDWRMSFLLGSLTFIFFLVNFIVLRLASGNQEKIETYHNAVYGRVGDVLGNIFVVQSFNRIEYEMRSMREVMTKLLSAQYPILTWWGLLTVLKQSTTTITMVFVFAYGSILVRNGELSVGQVVSFVGFAHLLVNKLEQLSDFVVGIFENTPTLKSYFEILDSPLHIMESKNAKAIDHVKGEVQFNNVSFKYRDSQQGVMNLNFQAKAGETIAFVGKTGSGKSTALALLQRIFDVQAGQITIDGIDVRDFKIDSLKKNIAVVFQEAGLFNRSIYENIQIGKLNCNIDEVLQAAKTSECLDFINQKKEKFDFVIGERGALLSGGERQRIAIARAFLKDAPILILDEATSALDYETEAKVKEAFDRVRKGRTTFIIAHRLSTVVSADKIIVMDNGKISEIGTYDQLKNNDGKFSQLIKNLKVPVD